MSQQTHQILIVEDEPGIAELLRFTLDGAGFTSALAGSADAARKSIASELPQVVLLDWMLPDAAGLSLLEAWRADSRTASLPVIMLTAKGTDEDKVRGLNAGADEYVTKPFSPRELIARIHAVLRRRTSGSGVILNTHGPIAIDAERNLVMIEGQVINLDQAEFKLLRFLMTHPERIFSRAQLLDKVWGDHVFIEERTVDVHVMRLRKAMGDAASYVKTVRSIGYVLAAVPPQ